MRTSVFATGGEFHLPVSRRVETHGQIEWPLDLEAGLHLCGPSVLVRPRIHTLDVGASMRCVFFGSLNSSMTLSRKSGRHPAGAMRKCWACVPVVLSRETRTHLSTCRASPTDSNARSYRVQTITGPLARSSRAPERRVSKLARTTSFSEAVG